MPSLLDPNYVYTNAEESQKPNYLREKFKKIRKEQEAARKREEEEKKAQRRRENTINIDHWLDDPRRGQASGLNRKIEI